LTGFRVPIPPRFACVSHLRGRDRVRKLAERSQSLRLVSAFILLAATPLIVAPAGVPEPLYTYRNEHDPNGIGKFYMGREIAHVMGHQAAEWLERPERNEEERTDLLVDSLKIKPGEVVADIGAGTGYLTRRLGEKVRPTGKVFAVDIQPEMLTLLTNKMLE